MCIRDSHHINIDDTPEFMRVIGNVGLSTREACGNTVRNVTGCQMAGVCADEPFDVTPYAAAYARFFVRHPVTQALPRKFKTAFSGCDRDCAITSIHDMGFIPKIVNGVKGFKVLTGGGTSIMPRIAPTLYEFVSVDEYLKVTEAVVRIFNRSDELRKNRMKARIKFLIARIGIEEFRTMVDEELKFTHLVVGGDSIEVTDVEGRKEGKLISLTTSLALSMVLLMVLQN